ncbi:MAG: aromatic amino acid transport family protein, partial [bacterium]|nr:aromatic amino acid transport family protein [bacterium]
MTKYTRWYKELILPAALLSSLIIGAGMFALPYLFNAAGILTGVFYLITSTFIFSIIHLRYGEVIEKTSGKHRFAGYARIYLGKRGFWLGAIVAGVGLTLVLTAYLALGPFFLRLFVPALGDSLNLYLFWGVGAVAILLSLN